MGYSEFQENHASALKQIFAERCGLHFQDEVPCRTGRIDLGTTDMRYGIEIKSSISDLKSGYGLNQGEFCWGYVLVPHSLVVQAIGWLYVNGMERAGVIEVDDDGYSLVKPAHGEPGHGVPTHEIICDIGDEIQHVFSACIL